MTEPDVSELVARARAGEPLAVGRLLSLVEAGGARGLRRSRPRWPTTAAALTSSG